MKKKIMIGIGIVLISILALGMVFYFVDAKRVEQGKLPLFCIPIGTLKDGGTKIYLGLGYKVIDYPTEDIQIGSWKLEYKEERNSNMHQEETTYFIATILEKNGTTLLVEPLEGEDIRHTADKLYISDKEQKDWKIGDTVKVTYMGYVMETYPAKVSTVKVESYIALKDIKQDYTTQEAILDGFVVDSYMGGYNKEIADEFRKKVENKQVAEIRILKYTVEGDSILTLVRYQNGKFKVWEDYTRDKFSAQQDRKIMYLEYENLQEKENSVYLYNGETLKIEKGSLYLYRN